MPRQFSRWLNSRIIAFHHGAGSDAVRLLGEKILADGPDKLQPSERVAVMADQRVMVWLHQQAWLRPEEKLAPWWKATVSYTHLTLPTNREV